MKQVHVFVSGNVQGVSFRYFLKINAQKLGITGWVRNTEDGGVEAVFCGEKENVEQMIELSKKGPMLADVKHLGYDWEEEESFEDFTIR